MEKALRRWREEEARRIPELIRKLMPLLYQMDESEIRCPLYFHPLKLWRLPDRYLNPDDHQVYKRYVDARGMLRYEPSRGRYDLPRPVNIGAEHVHPLQLRAWRKDLKKLYQQLKKSPAKSLKPVPAH
jgi:hypothetical protein